ncbi:hypothetical protein P3735_17645 [Vibrio parahaemolyticus]|nr:hypothetical protein [Vibrio parahaemolyticus]
MAVFLHKPNEIESVCVIRGYIYLDHFEGGVGALYLDIYSYSLPEDFYEWSIDEHEKRQLIFTFKNREGFKEAYEMARTIIKKGS